ncbi:uncharacterized protein MYCFIDRAFT_184415 [Pseudocercospora fijiensis CIRAD86]|uniref:FAD-dependent oxidoreductase 2 FAD-binding domain-containing protein n=1 Tax=Pseudocercospora fijiensis (strain CIRAD86) TaxID=383855 RepID=N1Q8X8_PSEFD|nr:uncharacterized protein MYCFIDRAFT_184415 [Pseudocercospora fijiensis CIRAD86]EME87343.1 hypothetical protein MYCFIDRAFT_184415 [Pseudocercospora fijiensis CIRAD86]
MAVLQEGLEPRPVGSYPKTGIDVLIVGTGLAGLTAAIECIRKGHNVRVLERNATINTQGDMYFMGLSATKFFKHWPEMKAEYDSIGIHNAWIETFKHSGERMIPPLSVAERLRDAGLDPKTPPGTFQMRPLIYRMFVRQVEKLGIDIEFNRRVVDYFEDEKTGKGGCVTDDGKRYEADVVIAADGVGSKSQKLVGGQVRARSSGRAMWRAAFPIENLEKNPEVKDFFKMVGPDGDCPCVRTFLGPGTYALTLTRPDTMIWIINHNATGSSAENWNNTIDYQEVLDEMDKGVGSKPWANIFKELIKTTPPKTIVNFELLWRDPQPSWTSPHARPFTRNACAQKLGFSNAELLQETDWEKVTLDPRRAQPKLPKWVWSHDPETYTYKHYHANVKSMEAGIPFDDSEIAERDPNFPKGYRYVPWTIDWIMECMRKGVAVDLGEGEWE